MIETLAVSTDLDMPVVALGWNYKRSPAGVQQWSAPSKELPDGLGSLLLSRAPDGAWRARAEGNITTLLHGKAWKYGSLYRDEVEAGSQALLDVAADFARGIPRQPERWWVRRYDPSQTFRVGQERTPHVLDGAERAFRREAAGLSRQSVTTVMPGTVTWRLSKHRSVTVYDKTLESISRNIPCPRGLVRVEVRRMILGNRLPLTDLEGRLVDEEDVERYIERMEAVSGSVVLQTVQHLMRGGADLAEAGRLASWAILLGAVGDSALEQLGMPYSTAHRTKVRIKQLLAHAGEMPEPTAAEMLKSSDRVMARDEAAAS